LIVAASASVRVPVPHAAQIKVESLPESPSAVPVPMSNRDDDKGGMLELAEAVKAEPLTLIPTPDAVQAAISVTGSPAEKLADTSAAPVCPEFSRSNPNLLVLFLK
jgi:hypothetical protein